MTRRCDTCGRTLPVAASYCADGGPGPDLCIAVDDASSGTCQLAAGSDHDSLRVVAHELLGSLAMDVDQYRVRRPRQVRIGATGDRPVRLDAVGHNRESTASHRHH